MTNCTINNNTKSDINHIKKIIITTNHVLFFLFGVLEVRGRLGGEVQCCAVLRARSGKVATGVFKEVISWLGW